MSGTTITVKDRDGTSGDDQDHGDHDFQVNGDNAALADVKVGMFLVAEGTKNSRRLADRDGRARRDAGDHGPGGRGFHGGPVRTRDHDNPNATAAPTATGSAG